MAAAGGSNRIAYLDGWRGLAIGTVLIGHFGGRIAPALQPLGSLGVEFFFVLSGRLMAEVLFMQRCPLPEFFLRRFSRTYPALLVMASAMIPIAAIGSRLGKHNILDLPNYIAALTFTINYRVAFMGTNSVLEHVWSLCVEEHAYAVLALVAFLSRRSQRSAGLIVGLIAIASLTDGALTQIITGGGVHEVYWRTDARVASVFLSVAIYLLVRARRIAWWVSPAAALLGASIQLSALPLWAHFVFGTPLLALAVNGLDSMPSSLRKVFSAPALTQLGLWSYSLYLWQQPFYASASSASFKLAPILLIAAFLPALFSYYFVEGPARRFLNTKFANRLGRVRQSPNIDARFALQGNGVAYPAELIQPSVAPEGTGF